VGTEPTDVTRCTSGTLVLAMSSERLSHPEDPKHLELSVEELLRRARPLPPHEALVIDDIDEVEGRAFLAAVDG
jgi:hypothetical protein